MWPNEQINGISFCGALMNGEKRAAFFHMAVGGGGGGSRALTRASNEPAGASAARRWSGINAFCEYR